METLFDVLGYRFDSGCFGDEPEKQDKGYILLTFRRAMSQYVWDAAQLEGNPITFPEVMTLMENITIGGHKVSDVEEVLGLTDSHKYLAELIKTDEFSLTKHVSDKLHYLLAHRSVLDAGMFRGEGNINVNVSVYLGEEGVYSPPEPTVKPGRRIIARYESIVQEIKDYTPSVWKHALMYNMAGCFQQFYFDGNKRTSRLMMNGLLMSNGYNAISIPASLKTKYNKVMVEAYASGDASEAISFVGNCYYRD